MPDSVSEEWRDRIDADVRSLSERMAGVESGMASLSMSFDKFTHRFDTNIREQQSSHRTQWPVIFGSLSLVLFILGGLLSGYVRDLNRIENDVMAIQGNRTSWADPVQDEKLNDIQAEIVAMRLNEHATLKFDSSVNERLMNLKETIERWKQVIDEKFAREIVVHDRIRSVYEDRVKYLEDKVFMAHPQMDSLHIPPDRESATDRDHRERLNELEKHLYDGHDHRDN